MLEDARTEAEESRRLADAYAAETRGKAEREAREQIRHAREVAAEVVADGTELGENLRALGTSLHTNAERLLRDVAAAHRAFRATLDDSGIADDGERSGRGIDGDDEFGEIPESIPRRPGRR